MKFEDAIQQMADYGLLNYNPWEFSYNSGGLSFAHYKLEQYAEAQDYAIKALQTALKIGTIHAGLMALLTLSGLVSSVQGEHERSIRLLSLIRGTLTLNPIEEFLVELILEVVRPQLSSEQYEQGKSLDLETVIQELLAEFGEEE